MSERYIRVEDNHNFQRDTRSNSIINCNTAEYERARRIKEKRRRAIQEMNELRSRLSACEDRIKELEDLINKNI